MAVIEHKRVFRRRSSRVVSGMPWVVAGISLVGGRAARAQSSVELRSLFYNESDGRTRVVNPTLLLHHEMSEALGQIDLLLSHDSISGASPTGDYPKFTPTTTTSASGITRTTGAGQVVTQAYTDERNSESLTYSRRFGSHLPTVDLSHSVEKDYTSNSVGLSDAWTMFDGRGTLHFGFSISDDTVSPGQITNDTITSVPNRHLPKKSNAYSLGWTWVLGSEDLLDVSASRTRLSGYLDEPYLVVSVGTTTKQFEHRPDTRVRDAYLIKHGHYFEWDGALKTSYRYYKDDWGLKAHTLDFTYDQHMDDGWILSPRLRYYAQNAASFYGAQFATAQPYMSADYRLSSLSSVLAGCSVSVELSDTLTLNAGATYQLQKGRNQLTPLQTAATATTPAVYSGPSVSAADMNTSTYTLGLKWRY